MKTVDEVDGLALWPSAALAAVVGKSPLTAREATRLVWAHVAAYGLRDTYNPHEIRCDAPLRALAGGRERVSRFELPAHVGQQLSVEPW